MLSKEKANKSFRTYKHTYCSFSQHMMVYLVNSIFLNLAFWTNKEWRNPFCASSQGSEQKTALYTPTVYDVKTNPFQYAKC